MKRLLLVGSIVIWSAAAAAAESVSEVDRIVEQLAPTGHVAHRFMRTYAARVSDRLGGLNDYAEFLSSKRPMACNLLCRNHVEAGFFHLPERGPGEFIAYVLTTTCYGAVPGQTHRGRALADLNEALVADNSMSDSAKLSNSDKRWLRRVLGTALKEHFEVDSLTNLDAAKRNIFRQVYALWQVSELGGSGHDNIRDLTATDARRVAAKAVCEKARFQPLP